MRRRRQDRGFVLIIALAALAVMMLLLLALLHGASGQMRDAESDAVVAREKMLADSTVSLVIGQIAQASTQPGQAWISQPGLVRTYDASGSRKPAACYKLYSAAAMIDASGNLIFSPAMFPPTGIPRRIKVSTRTSIRRKRRRVFSAHRSIQFSIPPR